MTVPEELLSEHIRNIAKQNDLRPSKGREACAVPGRAP